jgi:hypothetical protein
MFQAVRDYLPIPGSEADVERLFNTGRDMLGIRRFSISGRHTTGDDDAKGRS